MPNSTWRSYILRGQGQLKSIITFTICVREKRGVSERRKDLAQDLLLLRASPNTQGTALVTIAALGNKDGYRPQYPKQPTRPMHLIAVLSPMFLVER